MLLGEKKNISLFFLNYPKAVRYVFGITFLYNKEESRKYLETTG